MMRFSVNHYLFDPLSSTYEVDAIVMPILWMRKVMCRGHLYLPKVIQQASKWQSWSLGPGSVTGEPGHPPLCPTAS